MWGIGFRSILGTVVAVMLSHSFARAQLTDAAAVLPSTNERRPPYLAIRAEARYGTSLQRISNSNGAVAVGSVTFGSDARHHYSTDNPWSRNGRYYFMENGRGGGHCSNDAATSCNTDDPCGEGTCLGIPPPCHGACTDLILNGRTFAPRNAAPTVILPYGGGPDTGLTISDSWWDLQPGDGEDMRIAIDEVLGVVFKYSALTGRLAGPNESAIWPSGFPPSSGGIAPGVSEGQSWDGRLVVVASGDRKAIQLIEAIPGGRIGPTFDAFTLPSAAAPGTGSIAQMICGTEADPFPTGCAIDQVQVSASGRYVTLSYSYESDYTRVLSVDPATLAITEMDYTALDPVPHVYSGCFDGDPDPDVTHSTNALSHGFIFDLAHSSNGRNPHDGNADVLVGTNHCAGLIGASENGRKDIGAVIMVDLDDARVTPLTKSSASSPEAEASHVSMLAYDTPGYAFVTYAGGTPGAKFNEEIVRIKLSDHSVARFGRTHTPTDAEYRCEAHGVPAPDGQRVAFASCWTEYCGVPCSSGCDTPPLPSCGWADYTSRQDYILGPRVEPKRKPAALSR